MLVFLLLDDGKRVIEYFKTEKMRSNVDKKQYRVVAGFSDKQAAANKLSKVNIFITDFLEYCHTKFIVQGKGTIAQQKFVRRMLLNYNPDNLFENDPKPGEETSYVMNKGYKFALCLRKKGGSEDAKLHKDNILKFVALHELAHLGNITYGHDDSFWDGFRFLLLEAYKAKLYVPVDYKKENTQYCGMEVYENPLCDVKPELCTD